MLRKATYIGLVCLMVVGMASPADAQPTGAVRRVLLYVPNLVLDVLDIVNVNVGMGPGVHANVHATRYFQFGGGGSVSTKQGMIGRQVGCWHEDRYETSLTCISAEIVKQTPAKWVGVLVKPLDAEIGPKSWEAKAAEGKELDEKVLAAKRDMFGVGAAAHAAVLAVEAEFRLTEVLDAVLGALTFHYVDIREDDVK